MRSTEKEAQADRNIIGDILGGGGRPVQPATRQERKLRAITERRAALDVEHRKVVMQLPPEQLEAVRRTGVASLAIEEGRGVNMDREEDFRVILEKLHGLDDVQVHAVRQQVEGMGR